MSNENSACQIPVRHKTLFDGDVKICRTKASDESSCYGSSQILTLHSLAVTALCQIRIAHARVLSDTTHCPMVTSKYVCRRTVSDPIICYRSSQS